MLTTGAQGEEFAVLMRAATGRHKFLTLTERDTIMLSSSVIPGNELSVQKLKITYTERESRLLITEQVTYTPPVTEILENLYGLENK